MLSYTSELISGKLVRRYKRFLADILLNDGRVVTAHCTNSGTMKSCLEEGAAVYLSPANDPKRKTQFTWEMIFINNSWIGVNTLLPNKLIFDAIKKGAIHQLQGYPIIKREVKFDDSRFDIYLENNSEQCYVEVKNVSMKVGSNALFPDAVTARGRKHLDTLVKVKQAGMRAVMVYVIQRTDIDCFGIAADIDPNYYSAFQNALKHGVEVIPIQVKVSPLEVGILKQLPFI